MVTFIHVLSVNPVPLYCVVQPGLVVARKQSAADLLLLATGHTQVTFYSTEACVHIVNFGTNRGEFRPQPGQFGPNLIPEFLIGLIDEGDDRDNEDAYG